MSTGASIIDISSRGEGIARALSNFIERPFIIDGVSCASMEGFLQSIKFPKSNDQAFIASHSGYDAFRRGQEMNCWKADQILFWQGDPYCRHSQDYIELIGRAYDAQFDQSTEFQAVLLSSVGQRLRHSMGKANPRDTVLTESEYINQLERLRWRALVEK